MEHFFDVNDFLINPKNQLYKVEVELKTSFSSNKEIVTNREVRYIVLTDIFLLILKPCQLKCCDKSKAKLTFIGEIREIDSFKNMKVFSTEKEKEKSNLVGFVIKWDSSTQFFDNVIVMDYYQCKKFMDAAEHRRKLLLENFSMFQEDMNVINSLIYYTKVDDDETQKLIELVEYKENVLLEDNCEQNLKDLMLLYQKIIEVLSAKNNDDYLNYIVKLQKLLDSADRINTQNLDDDNSFNLLP